MLSNMITFFVIKHDNFIIKFDNNFLVPGSKLAKGEAYLNYWRATHDHAPIPPDAGWNYH